jgi:hypothetical protein
MAEQLQQASVKAAAEKTIEAQEHARRMEAWKDTVTGTIEGTGRRIQPGHRIKLLYQIGRCLPTTAT